MSNGAEIEKQIAERVSFYAASAWRKPVSEATAWVYARALAELGAELAEAALSSLAMKQTFFPAIAEVRQAARGLAVAAAGKAEKGWDESWNEVMKAARKSPKCPHFNDSTTAEAVRIFGWDRFLSMESNEYEVCRAHFRDIFNNIKARKRDEADNRAVLRLLGHEAAERIKALSPSPHAPAAVETAAGKPDGDGANKPAPPPAQRLAELYDKLAQIGLGGP